MVIHQFNKLIRNKWLWGVFAILISAFFAFDFLLDGLREDRTERPSGDAGKLAGEAVDASMFLAIADDIRGIGRNRDYKTEQSEVNRTAWENYAAIKVAGRNGIEATDADVMARIRRDPSFQTNGSFDFQRYKMVLRDNSFTPEMFEAMLKRRLTLMRIGQDVLSAASWASPMELDQALADMTDVFTVKVATFTQDPKDAAAVKLDDAGLRKWYDANVKSLELPERMKIRYVKFDAARKDILDKMTVTEDDIHDRYDVTIEKYTTTDTNGVETVRKFDELTKEEKAAIEHDLRVLAAVTYFETNINFRVFAIKAKEGASRLDEIAAEESLKVETSDWFSSDGGFQAGFMSMASTILPGAKDFVEAVAELDPAVEDMRYAVVSSEKAVWLVERAETSPKHTPDFAEAKEAIRPRALEAAKADAFKASVEAVVKQGADAVRAVKSISTNYVFSVSDLRSAQFPDQMSVARAAMKLTKGAVSEFTPAGRGRAVVVVCEDRVAGDAAKAMVLRSQVMNDLTMLQQRQLPSAWLKWNLGRMGFEPGGISSVEKAEADE